MPASPAGRTIRRFGEWNLWGYIDARDCAQAVEQALHVDLVGADHLIIANADTVMETPSAELMAQVFPDVPLAGTVAGHADAALDRQGAARARLRAGVFLADRLSHHDIARQARPSHAREVAWMIRSPRACAEADAGITYAMHSFYFAGSETAHSSVSCAEPVRSAVMRRTAPTTGETPYVPFAQVFTAFAASGSAIGLCRCGAFARRPPSNFTVAEYSSKTGPYFEKVAADFEAANPDIEINIEVVPWDIAAAAADHRHRGRHPA